MHKQHEAAAEHGTKPETHETTARGWVKATGKETAAQPEATNFSEAHVHAVKAHPVQSR